MQVLETEAMLFTAVWSEPCPVVEVREECWISEHAKEVEQVAVEVVVHLHGTEFLSQQHARASAECLDVGVVLGNQRQESRGEH